MKELEEAARAEYPEHPVPDEYWYPNSAIKGMKEAAFIEGAQWQSQQSLPGWVDVRERLPEDGHYLTAWFHPDGAWVIDATTLEYGQWHFGQDNITHWMPLPTPPNK